MALTPEEIANMVAQAQEQASATNVATTAPTVEKIKVGEIISPKIEEYKTPEQLREDAEKLALETELELEATNLEARLVEDYTLTDEQRAEIESRLAELKPKETTDVAEKEETPEEEIARLKKELEEVKAGKHVEEVINPLETVEKKAEEAGINIPEMYTEYINNGELSAESLKSLLDAGFNETAIEAYINTKTVQEQAKADSIISETVGTKEVYAEMSDWMLSNLTEAELNTYNAGVNTEHAKIYIENMYSKFTKATVKPTIIRDNGFVREGNQVSAGFKSLNEQNLALADIRYGKDVKYTAQVRDKMMKSTF